MTQSFESEWQARFERFARTYEDEALVSGWSAEGLARRVRVFQALVATLELPARAVALDLGCGAGTYVRLLGGLGHRAVGLDYSLPSLDRALAADPGRKGSYLAGEAYALPFRAASLDLVVSIGVLQALADPARALGEMACALRPGGWVVVETLNACALVARARRAHEAARRQAPRVRAWDPDRTRALIAGCGLALRGEVPVWLPPRRVPQLGRLLDSPPVARALAAFRALARVGAHAFLFVAQKPASQRGGMA